MKRILTAGALSLVVIACDKDNFETKPQISSVSFNTDVLPNNTPLTVRLGFTDKEGDIDTVYVLRQRLNVRGPASRPGLPLRLPEFNNEQKGEIQIQMDFATYVTLNLNPINVPGTNPPQRERDTLNLRFVVKDRGGNFSDTTAPKRLIVIR